MVRSKILLIDMGMGNQIPLKDKWDGYLEDSRAQNHLVLGLCCLAIIAQSPEGVYGMIVLCWFLVSADSHSNLFNKNNLYICWFSE